MITIELMNTRDVSKFSRKAKAADKRELALLDKQVTIYNAAYSLLEHAKPTERARLKKFLKLVGRSIDRSISRRNKGYEAACKAAGLDVNVAAPKRPRKQNVRRTMKRAQTLVQVLKLKNEFKSLPKAA